MPLDVKIRQINAAVDRYINKVNRRNQPLDYWKTEKQFKQFMNLLKGSLSAQMKEVADRFMVVKDSRVKNTNPNMREYLGSWMHRNFKPLGNYLVLSDLEAYFKDVFEYSAKTSYIQHGVIAKAQVDFTLTNDLYLTEIRDQASYLLNKSSVDDTTFNSLFGIISDGLTEGLTSYEVAQTILENVNGISSARAMTIANTETANTMGKANIAWMRENGVNQKEWITAGNNPCRICDMNEADGSIPVDDYFSSGDDTVPAHPNCECYVNSVKADLAEISNEELWNGD